LNRYCQLLNSTNSVSAAYTEFWAEKNVRVGWDAIPPYNNTIENTPHVCFKVPTGGGKTFLACNALKTIFDNLPSKKSKTGGLACPVGSHFNANAEKSFRSGAPLSPKDRIAFQRSGSGLQQATGFGRAAVQSHNRQ